jgi:pantoate--beta-alanine ligase
MEIVMRVNEVRRQREGLTNPFGLVPTMGFLHEGHLSLVRRARAECASVGVSIFVNPTQFSPQEDLTAYPRDLERDLALLEREGVDLVWTPTLEEMYPEHFQTWVTVEGVSQGLEGAQRPGHFRGVATVVSKLFNVFQPDKAYFGQKDAQQSLVIRRMVQDLNFPVEVVVCPTMREADGLAMSSRNAYLNADERRAATVLFRALCAARDAFSNGERDAEALRRRMTEIIRDEPMAQEQYASVADAEALQELNGPVERALLSMAVRIGKTRLIDNMIIGD